MKTFLYGHFNVNFSLDIQIVAGKIVGVRK